MNRWTRRLAVSTGLSLAAMGIAVPLSLSTGAASAAPDPLTSLSAFADPSAVKGSTLHQQLKDDLKAAWNAPDGQRVAALQQVLQKAVGGSYGEDVKQRAIRLQSRLSQMDPTLKADLQRAIELPKDQRRAALKDIRQKVLDGDYGQQAQRHAKLLKRLLRHRFGG